MERFVYIRSVLKVAKSSQTDFLLQPEPAHVTSNKSVEKRTSYTKQSKEFVYDFFHKQDLSQVLRSVVCLQYAVSF